MPHPAQAGFDSLPATTEGCRGMSPTNRRGGQPAAAADVDPGGLASQRPAGAPERGPRASRVIHHVLGWLLAAAATALAVSGQVEYAMSADITDWRRFL